VFGIWHYSILTFVLPDETQSINRNHRVKNMLWYENLHGKETPTHILLYYTGFDSPFQYSFCIFRFFPATFVKKREGTHLLPARNEKYKFLHVPIKKLAFYYCYSRKNMVQ